MKDPWRVDDPLRVPQKPRIDDPDKPPRISRMEELDLDADWQPHKSCFLRFKSCVLEIRGPDLQTPRDALDKLARCIRDLWKTGQRDRLREIGVVAATRSFVTESIDASAAPAARLSCEDVALSFIMQSLDDGTLQLARFLIEMNRHSITATVLKKHGVYPMLRTS